MSPQAVARDASAKLPANRFTNSGCTFIGWSQTKTGKVAYADAASVRNLAAAGESVTLYAQWAKTKYSVSYNRNGGKLPAGKKMDKQTMTYGKSTKLRKNVFKRKDHVFIGWATSKNGTVKYKNASPVKNLRTDGKTTKLYAKWAKKTYKVAFKANGGSGKMSAQKMTYGKSAKLRKNAFKRTGYAFAGWAKTRTGKVVYKNAASVKNLRADGKTLALYARWTPTTYKVAFQGNGGSGTMAAQSLTYGKTAKLRANAFQRTGYAFAGWAKTATGAVAYKDAASVENLRADGKTTTLYAQWTLTTYQVAYNANGGRGTMAAQGIQYNAMAKLRANAFVRDGFTFQGWSKTATGAVAYGNQASVRNLRADGGTVTLYAVWAAAKTKSGVPYTWIDAKAAGILAANGGNYEAAAGARAANGVNTVQECYAAGLDPSNPDEFFTATLSVVDGKPVVSSRPKGVEGRVYTLEAKKNLLDAEWTDVTDMANPGAAGFRFFRVGVALME